MKKIFIIAGLVFSISLFGQIKTNNDVAQNDASDLTPFLDASSSSYWNGSDNNGKGLVFPRTDLSTLTEIVGPGRPGDDNAPTRYDGMIVYNTKEGGKPAIGATDDTPELEKGFYYYDNKTDNFQGGHWVKIADINPESKTKLWTLNGNGGTTPVTTDDFVASVNDDPALRDYSFNPEGKNFIGTTDNKNVTFATGEANDAGGFKTVARLAIGDIKNRTENKSKFKFVMEVYGKAHFEDGIVTTASTYPDYVFDNYFTGKSDVNPDYKFKKLNEVEAFIKENNHLPGVTKIDDLAKTESGYEVDNTQLSIQTLEKVEELYLHLIEQQKEIQALKAQIAELKK